LALASVPCLDGGAVQYYPRSRRRLPTVGSLSKARPEAAGWGAALSDYWAFDFRSGLRPGMNIGVIFR